MKPETKQKLWEWVRTLGLALAIALLFRAYVVEARWIPSESMVPTLEVGDRLFVDKISYKLHDIERGDIVVFEAPAQSQQEDDLIKRVIGLPGDTVEIKQGIVYVNDQPLDEPYEKEQPRNDFAKITVPANSYFMMGDNRNNSNDSRYWGFVTEEQVIGKALFRFFPFDRITLVD